MLFPNYSRILLGSSIAFLSVGALIGYTPRAKAINIIFDYTYDDNDFFTGVNAGRQDLLDRAASYFENNINDSLPALSPGAEETFTIEKQSGLQ